MMVDTGAVYTCVNSNYASHLPLTGKFLKTIGFSGQMQLIPLTAPVCLQTKNKSVTMPILVSNQTPVNLLGRDALCKLGLQIWCSPEAPVCLQTKNKSVTMPILVSNQTPDNLLGRDALCKLGLQIWCSPEGVYIDTIGIETQMMVVEPKANVYWIGHIQPDVSQTIHKWGKCIEAQIPGAQIPKSEFPCTMIYDSEKDEKIEQKWQEETKEEQIEIVSQYIIIGKQGTALNVPDCTSVKKWFSVTNSVPHNAVYVGKNWETKDLGPMMKKAEQSKWEPTEHP